mmetsp:Transcript_54842/g.101462  ORF Transcript_54842/g.101462 Transcript_54842/m.101462 type:complete len:535 (+) Transcript_54842:97-1701(+)
MGCSGSSGEASAPVPPTATTTVTETVHCGKCGTSFQVVVPVGQESTAPCPSCGALNKFGSGSKPSAPAVAKPEPASAPPTTKSMKSAKSMVGAGKTKDLLEHELSGSVRQPCRYGLNCYRKHGEHLDLFSHPDDDDYVFAIRKHGAKGEFLSLKDCYRYMDPFNKGIIDDKSLLAELMGHLGKPLSAEELDAVWGQLDDDGNGYASFSEFIEWAKGYGIDLPLGIENPVEDSATNLNLACTYAGCACQNFRGKGRICKCGHKRGLHLADQSDIVAAVPPNWTHQDSKDDYSEWVSCSDEEKQHVQTLMEASAKQVWTRDRGRDSSGGQKKVPNAFEVVELQRNENAKIWRKYALKRRLIKDNLTEDTSDMEKIEVKTSVAGDWPGAAGLLDGSINEWHLWHGTSVAGAKQICEVDFKQRYAGSVTGTLYGPGTYFADSCTKADEYAGVVPTGDSVDPDDPVYIILLCRVIGGRVNYNDEVEPNAEDLTASCLHDKYDSVLGDREKCRNTFKEFVIFGSDQAYPEYIVHYKRKWS